jgi:hypothetical protein
MKISVSYAMIIQFIALIIDFFVVPFSPFPCGEAPCMDAAEKYTGGNHNEAT